MSIKPLIVYDSVYGNTEKIAKSIGKALGSESKVLRVSEASLFDLKKINLLIVGSPVHGGKPTTDIEKFLKSIPFNYLKHMRVAAFDTRFATENHGIGVRILMKVIRYAAHRIAKILVQKGGKLIAKPEGFIVEDKEGPLKKGEATRAARWVKDFLEKQKETV